MSPRKIAIAAVSAFAALVLTACTSPGGSTTPSDSAAAEVDFCTAITNVTAALKEQVAVGQEQPADQAKLATAYDNTVSALQSAAAIAPDEYKAGLETLATTYGNLADAAKSGDAAAIQTAEKATKSDDALAAAKVLGQAQGSCR
ncbi:MAG: hypothetical protein LBR58_09955 [Propionibacteriaceae bacterium]|jgi:hypothetical protein|nr:hypothetical protein [Propionibacteriaceae bacterium]